MTNRGGHESASCARIGALVALLGIGCGEPSADVVVMWVDGVGDDEGKRSGRIYERGERDQIRIAPDIFGSDVDPLQVGVDRRAQGIAIAGELTTSWVELGSGRRVTLSAAAIGREEEILPGFSFTRSGDGVMRGLDIDSMDPPVWAFAPLSGPYGLRTHAIGPGRGTTGRWSLRSADDAPVLIFAEISGTPSQISGEVQAWAYPSEYGEGPLVDDLRPLARGSMIGRGVADEDGIYLEGCPDRLCVAPSGRYVYAMTPGGGCDLWRWSWVEAESTGADTPAERVAVVCPGDDVAVLSAVLDDDLIVLDDRQRLYLVDLSASTIESIPKPIGELTPHEADHGHALLVSSSQGEVVRLDASGPRMISGIQTPCGDPDGFAVSPSGTWVVQSCTGQSGADGLDGQVRRISVLDAELFTGIPMRPIAIDDDGNALLYSVSSDEDDETPRGLFVLTGDGQLTRVDELEPFPGQVTLPGEDGERIQGRFSSAGSY